MTLQIPSRVMVAAMLLAGAELTGCNQYPDLAAVSGEVKFADGKPIAAGSIEFAGLDQTLVSGALIRDGKYQVPRAHGLKAGKYRVRIYAPEQMATDATPRVPGEVLPLSPPKELVPPKYNRESQLEAAVESTNDQTFDFVIE